VPKTFWQTHSLSFPPPLSLFLKSQTIFLCLSFSLSFSLFHLSLFHDQFYFSYLSFLLLLPFSSSALSPSSSQFHQCFTSAFFEQKCFFCQNVTREKLREALSYKKRAHKMLVKLTPPALFSSSTFFLSCSNCTAFTLTLQLFSLPLLSFYDSSLALSLSLSFSVSCFSFLYPLVSSSTVLFHFLSHTHLHQIMSFFLSLFICNFPLLVLSPSFLLSFLSSPRP